MYFDDVDLVMVAVICLELAFCEEKRDPAPLNRKNPNIVVNRWETASVGRFLGFLNSFFVAISIEQLELDR